MLLLLRLNLDPTGSTSKSDAESGALSDVVFSLSVGSVQDALTALDAITTILLSGVHETATASEGLAIATPALLVMIDPAGAELATVTEGAALLVTPDNTGEEIATLADNASLLATPQDFDIGQIDDAVSTINVTGIGDDALISEAAEIIETMMINVSDVDFATATDEASVEIQYKAGGGWGRSGDEPRRTRPLPTTIGPAKPSMFDFPTIVPQYLPEAIDPATGRLIPLEEVYLKPIDEDVAMMTAEMVLA